MLAKLRKYFLSGLVVFLPISLTIYLFFLAIDFFDGILGKYLEPFFAENFGFYFSGLSIIIGVSIIILIGFLATNFLGKKIYHFFDGMLERLPIFKSIYMAMKEMATFLFARDRFSSFKKVVLVEYPRKGIYAFGFLTNDTSERIAKKTKKELCNVFLPSAPGPLTGYVVLVPKNEIVLLDISVEDAIKVIVSGGVVNP